MAGFEPGGAGGPTPPGYVWDAVRRVYVPYGKAVPTQTYRGRPTNIPVPGAGPSSQYGEGGGGVDGAGASRTSGGGGGGASVGGPQADFDEQLRRQAQIDAAQQGLRAADETRQAGFRTAEQQASARYQAEDEARREAANQRDFQMRVSALQQMVGGGGGTSAPGVSGGGGDETGGENAIINRAKDRQGLQLRGALDALRSEMSTRGVVAGSPVEQQETGNILAGGAAQQGELNRDLMIAGLQRARQVADRNYAGMLTQRGQDIEARSPLFSVFSSGGRVY